MHQDFTPELLLLAYKAGIFPMGDGNDIGWYSPDPRCIFDLNSVHISKRLERTYKKQLFEIRINTAWNDVIRACGQLRDNTWITEEIVRVYTVLHENKFAHSVEAFQDNKLVGGLYGVSIGGAFMGESMFHLVTDASKVCLVYLVERLRKRGFVLLDSQYMTPHLRRFGAVNVSRDEYLHRLKEALLLKCKFAE